MRIRGVSVFKGKATDPEPISTVTSAVGNCARSASGRAKLLGVPNVNFGRIKFEAHGGQAVGPGPEIFRGHNRWAGDDSVICVGPRVTLGQRLHLRQGLGQYQSERETAEAISLRDARVRGQEAAGARVCLHDRRCGLMEPREMHGCQSGVSSLPGRRGPPVGPLR